jgi:hypothetical protein
MKIGAIFAKMISDVDAGDINSCSIVPASRSLTMVAEETREPFRMQSNPKTPVTVNRTSDFCRASVRHARYGPPTMNGISEGDEMREYGQNVSFRAVCR